MKSINTKSCETLCDSSVLSETDETVLASQTQLPSFLHSAREILPHQLTEILPDKLTTFNHHTHSIKFQNTVESFCPSLDSSLKLWEYLSKNVVEIPPTMKINVKGTHVQIDSDNVILDFEFTLDASKFVDKEWIRLLNLDTSRSWETVLVHYIESLQWFKGY
jgi:hypothetical protein